MVRDSHCNRWQYQGMYVAMDQCMHAQKQSETTYGKWALLLPRARGWATSFRPWRWKNPTTSNILRPYPGEDASMLIKRGAAHSDKELFTTGGDRLTLSCEGMNRPGKWLSMLASSGDSAVHANAVLDLEDPVGAVRVWSPRHNHIANNLIRWGITPMVNVTSDEQQGCTSKYGSIPTDQQLIDEQYIT